MVKITVQVIYGLLDSCLNTHSVEIWMFDPYDLSQAGGNSCWGSSCSQGGSQSVSHWATVIQHLAGVDTRGQLILLG